MKILSFLVLVLFASSVVQAQQTIGKLTPGQTYTNQSDDVIFYMPQSKVITLLNYQTKAEFDSLRVLKYKELVGNMELRILEADSAVSLRNYEAQYWKMQLENNDQQLQEMRIQKENLIYENHKIRRTRLFFLLAGVVGTSILFIGSN